MPSLRLRLVTRPMPYQVGLDFALAETAAVLVWALDAGAEPRDETWFVFEPEARRFAVGAPLENLPELPEGLVGHELELERIDAEPVPARLDQLRDRLADRPRTLARGIHDPRSGALTGFELWRPRSTT